MVPGKGIARYVGPTPGRAEGLGAGVGRAAPGHALAAGVGMLPPVLGAIRVGLIQAAHPFVDVTGHVPHTVGCRALSQRSHGHGLAPAGAVAGTALVRRPIAPRVGAIFGASRGALPFRLGRQAFAAPPAIKLGAVPTGLYGRVVLEALIGAHDEDLVSNGGDIFIVNNCG